MKKFSFSLAHKSVVAVIAILLPILVTFLIGYDRNRALVRERTLDDLEIIADSYETLVYQFLEMSKNRAVDFASDGFIREYLVRAAAGDESAAVELGDHLRRNKMPLEDSIRAIAVVSFNGEIEAATDPSYVGRDVSDRDFFTKGMKGPFITEGAEGILPEPGLVVSTPVRDRVNGAPIGVLANFIAISELDRVLSGDFARNLGALTSGTGSRKMMAVYVVNRDRRVIASSGVTSDEDSWGKTIDSLPVNACLQAGREVSDFYRDHHGMDVVGASMCIRPLRWTLLVEIHADEALGALKVMRRDALVTAIIVCGLIGVVFVLLNRRVIGPVRRIAAAAAEISLGNYNVSIPVESGDEIGALSEAFNSMVREVKTTTTAFRESEARLVNAQRIAHIGNWEWDIVGNRLYWYNEIYRIFGVSPGEFEATYEAFLDRVHPDDRESVMKAVDEALKGKPYSIDHRIVLPDGRERIVHEEAEIYYGDDGRPVRMVGTVQDVTDRRKVEDELRRIKESLSEAQEVAHLGNWDWNIATGDLFLSDEMCRIFGVEPGGTTVGFEHLIDRVHPDDRESVKKVMDRALDGKTPYEVEHRITRPDGSVRTIYQRATVRTDERGKPLRMIGIVQDITEKRRTEFELKKLSMAIEQSVNIVFMCDVSGKIEYVNSRFEEVTGWHRDEVLGRTPNILASGETDREEYEELWKTILSGNTWRGVFKNRKKNGEFYWAATMITPIKDDRGKVIHFLAIQEDVTEKRKAQERLEYLATYDDLTGLLNRASFMERLKEWISCAGEPRLLGALLLIDIDQFKFINDTYGHVTGDEYLRCIARLLRETVPANHAPCAGSEGIISRLGADEFGIFLAVSSREEGIALAERICKKVEGTSIGNGVVRSTVSIGIVYYPEHGSTVKDLFTKADAALYRVRELGQNRYHVYSPEDKDLENIQFRLAWRERIQEALREDRFEIWFQPILDLRSSSITHYETLVRMSDKEGNIILPGLFIDLAETFGLVGSIDRIVAEKAMKCQAELGRGGNDLVFSVNVSGKELLDVKYGDFLRSKIRETGADPKRLIFEITETAAVHDMEKAKDFICQLKTMGCKFSLDDFGVGFTSFVYLREMEVDYVKIDGSFIRKLHENFDDQLVVKAIVDVAKGMGIKTVAEFVEDGETLSLLKEFGVDYAQGYHVGRPIAEREFRKRLMAGEK